MVSLGGAVLDLAGGAYLTSKPLVFPPGYADYTIMGGMLVAAADFPAGAVLLRIGANDSTKGDSVHNLVI